MSSDEHSGSEGAFDSSDDELYEAEYYSSGLDTDDEADKRDPNVNRDSVGQVILLSVQGNFYICFIF